MVANMNISMADLKPHNGNLINFFGKQVLVEGMIKLRVTLGMWPTVVDMNIDFLVIEASNIAYNAIPRRMSLNKARVIVSPSIC